ncbi:MAG: glutamyl-tRNA(Gln) amidotransferase subunit E [Ignavibacteriaceae bacterium]|nr:MAG: Glu-tRNA(Gln) amidotransferase GatDE subunit E [Chlorobiota bacterium]GJQ31546.1 MAG: glutamyl-tRNA(Gln) amidotransferase subunit E [Ignavibacteriaceae bacterium]
MTDHKFKPFSEMTDEDYRAVGFKSGLEVHQQLLTEKKLFCRCPAGRYSENYNAEILRHMRPTLSELGEYDGTALMEFKTKKEIIYRINRETVCTYEMDDTPPFEINDEALDIAFGIGMIYGSSMVDEVHIARKQYLDGSIPTGFQRTAIVCLDGSIPYKDREIQVIQLSIEEDSCREVSDIGHRRTYITDRLGMPLIETVTGPDMRTPQEVAEVGELIRRIARSTGKVRTGIGAARQDVNVSVTGGTRIEIKGVPRIPLIPLLTYNEAMRQWNLLRLRDELHRRGITPETFTATTTDVTKILRKTRYQPITGAVTSGMKVMCVLLKGFRGLLRWETQTDTHFSREISDRVRVISCLTTLPNIIHSDSPSETIASSEWSALKKTVGATEDDVIVLVWGDETDAPAGANEVVIRAKEATIGVPSETRQALRDGTNGFERILPGPDRMYPDTDLPPKKITAERLAKIRAGLPTPVWEREKKYHDLGIPLHRAKTLAASAWARVFEEATGNHGLNARFVSELLVDRLKPLRRKLGKNLKLTPELAGLLLNHFAEGRILRDPLFFMMAAAARTGELPAEAAGPPATTSEIKEAVKAAAASVAKMELRDPANGMRLAMGLAMSKLRFRANGKDVKALVEEVYNG